MKRLYKDPDATQILDYYKERVWPMIKAGIKDPKYPHHFRIPSLYKPEQKLYWEATIDYPKRQGKYLRPTLLLLTAEAMGIGRNKAIMAVAAAMQLSEEWLLIHDDVQDDSSLRRGQSALHRKYSNEIAINSGDYLQTLMWKTLNDHRHLLSPKIYNRVYDEFYTMLSRTILGQSVEANWMKQKRNELSNDDWFFIADSKSAYYTIAGPMRLGAILAGATEGQLSQIAKFGLHLGRAFQLVDDILDLAGDFNGKKEWANDIYEGKRTVILSHLLQKSGPRDKKKLLKILDKPRALKTEDEVRFVLERMSRYGSIIYAQKLTSEQKDKAHEVWNKELKFLKEQPARARLEKIIEFVTEREY